MGYTYEVEGIEIGAMPTPHMQESLLYLALSTAAILAYREARPIPVRFQGHVYRIVSVEVPRPPTPIRP